MPEKLLTIHEASNILGVTEGEIRALVERGVFPAYRIGGKFLRFRKEQIFAIRSEIHAEHIRRKPEEATPIKPRVTGEDFWTFSISMTFISSP